MKSLSLLHQTTVTLGRALGQVSLLSFAVDPFNHTCYMAYSDQAAHIVHLCSLNKTLDKASHHQQLHPIASLNNQGSILCLHYLPESDVLFIAFSHGELSLIHLNGADPTQIGTFDDPLLSCSWSPDNETLVLVTESLHYIVMNSDFDVVCDRVDLLALNPENRHVSVGWGKVETQFKGSLYKNNSTNLTTETTTPAPDLTDDLVPRTTWHGNASLFAIHFLNPETNHRQFYTFDIYGTLVSSSLSNPHSDAFVVHHPLAWKPAGNLIASTQTNLYTNATQVIFYEPNALRHGEFGLPSWINHLSLDQYRVRDLYWNCDSTVLLVWVRLLDDTNCDYLLLYSCKNAHWYLKQTLCFPIAQTRFIHVCWDVLDPLGLHLTTSNGVYWSLNWTWDTLRQSVSSVKHFAGVGVIDGDQVLYTPLAITNIPPPYSKSKLVVRDNAKSVAFCTQPLFLEWIAVLHGSRDNLVSIFDGSDSNPNLVASFTIPSVSHLNLRQLHFPNCNTLVTVGYDMDLGVDIIVHVQFDTSIPNSIKCSTTRLPFIAGQSCTVPANLSVATFETIVILQDRGGSLWRATWDSCTDEYQVVQESQFTSFCNWMAAIPHSELDLIIGLTIRSKLMLTHRELDKPLTLSSECSSFLVHSTYLIYTTLSHQLVFVPIADLLSSLPNTTNNNGLVRSIERGAVLVTAHPLGSGLVLQMPRGNLETVYPRPLVVNQIVDQIRNGDWGLAISAIRKHRVEFNILVDYDLDSFLKAAPVWMDQVYHSDHVNLILSSLKDHEDVVASLYPWIEYPNRNKSVGSQQSKVALVCKAVRQVILNNLNSSEWVNTLITTYIKSSPADTQSALSLVKQYVSQGQVKVAEQALKYAIFLVNVDVLYNEALGMYDFELTNMVAQYSNKDPREYLPFLQELQALAPDAYQKYRIDTHLGRSRSAFTHLLKADVHQANECKLIPGLDTFNEVVVFLAQHAEYYPMAVSCYHQANLQKSTQQKLTTIATKYGEHLESQGLYKEAGCMYEMGEAWDMAQSVWGKAEGEWRRVLSVASHRSKIGNGDSSSVDLVRVAGKLADSLIERTEFEAAACILCEYVGDIEAGISQYIRGYQYSEACRRAFLYDRSDLVESLVHPGIRAGCTELVELVNECRSDIQQRVDRLLELRAEKQLRSEPAEDSDLVYDSKLDHLETLPDSTSMLSTFTGMTLNTTQSTVGNRTSSSGRRSRASSSKQKRKQERKRHSGKKGSVYEYAYLIDSLTQLVSGRIQTLCADVRRVLPELVQFRDLERGRVLQSAYQGLLTYTEMNAFPVLRHVDDLASNEQERLVNQYRIVAETGCSLEEAASRLDSVRQVTTALPTLPLPSEWKLGILDASWLLPEA